MTSEEWRPIQGDEGRYEVSTLGRVRSLWIRNRRANRPRQVPKIMSPRRVKDGYLAVTLSKNGEQKTTVIHRLVLTAFYGPRPHGMEAAHLDGRKQNNCLMNLAWVTHAVNEQHKIAHGTRRCGLRVPWARLSDDAVREIRVLYARGGMTQAALAKQYGVSRNHIGNIITGHRRSSVT